MTGPSDGELLATPMMLRTAKVATTPETATASTVSAPTAEEVSPQSDEAELVSSERSRRGDAGRRSPGPAPADFPGRLLIGYR